MDIKVAPRKLNIDTSKNVLVKEVGEEFKSRIADNKSASYAERYFIKQLEIDSKLGIQKFLLIP